jgi:hypothetical protein
LASLASKSVEWAISLSENSVDIKIMGPLFNSKWVKNNGNR